MLVRNLEDLTIHQGTHEIYTDLPEIDQVVKV
jgi:hypothetical protein